MNLRIRCGDLKESHRVSAEMGSHTLCHYIQSSDSSLY